MSSTSSRRTSQPCNAGLESPGSTSFISGGCAGCGCCGTCGGLITDCLPYSGRSSRHPVRSDDPATDDHATGPLTLLALSDDPSVGTILCASATKVTDTGTSCRIGKSANSGLLSLLRAWVRCSTTSHEPACTRATLPAANSSTSPRPRACPKRPSRGGRPGTAVAPKSSRRSWTRTRPSAASRRTTCGPPRWTHGRQNDPRSTP